jgi:hypothetical protein
MMVGLVEVATHREQYPVGIPLAYRTGGEPKKEFEG